MKKTTCDRCGKEIQGTARFQVRKFQATTPAHQTVITFALPGEPSEYDFCTLKCLEAWAYEQQRPN